MNSALVISASDGSVFVEGFDLCLRGGTAMAHAAALLAPLSPSSVDHRNGYAWLNCKGVFLGGLPAAISLCFFHARLQEIHFGVMLDAGSAAAHWPSEAEIEAEVRFARAEFGRIFGRTFDAGVEAFPWGSAWAEYDRKGGVASAGIRYATR